MRSTFSLFWAALVATRVAASPPVRVSLRSSWAAPPFLAEILETISLENPDAFFGLVDDLTDPQVAPAWSSMTPEAIHQAGLEMGIESGRIQDQGTLANVQMNLAMHAAAPKLEAYFNFYDANHAKSHGKRCGSWVDWYGEVVCDVETLAQLVGVEAIDAGSQEIPQPRPKTLSFDHIYPPPSKVVERPPRTAVLYASLDSQNFRELHSYLYKVVNTLDPHVEYIFRYVSPPKTDGPRSFLSGYGVSLDLKKTDYLAIDDRNINAAGVNQATGDQEQKPDPVLPLILSYPANETAPESSVPLTTEELTKLGSNTAQIIADSADPLSVLTQIAQNFPKYASALGRRLIANESIEEELHNNSLRVQRGGNAMWINGLMVDLKDAHPFGLMRLLRKEKVVMQSLIAQGLENLEAVEVLNHQAIAVTQMKESGGMDALFDASDRPEGREITVWFNDMEKDKRYARWNPSFYALLRPPYPGAMPAVKANLFNVVLILDLSKISALNFIGGPMTNIIARDFPLRFGLVPVVETEEGKKMARLFYYLVKTYGRKKTTEFLSLLSQVALPAHMQTETVQWEAVRQLYDKLTATEREEKPEALIASLETILNDESDEALPLEKLLAYQDRLSASLASSPGGHAFFNGKHMTVDEEFLRNLQVEMSTQMQFFQEQVYSGQLTDNDRGETMSNYFYDLPTTSKRRNQYIYPSGSAALRVFNLHDLFTQTLFLASPASYLYPTEFKEISQTLFVIADLDSKDGVEIVKEAIASITANSQTRLGFIHNPVVPSVSEGKERPPVSWLLAHLQKSNLLSKTSRDTLLSVLVEHQPPAENMKQVPLQENELFNTFTDGVSLADIQPELYVDYLKSSRLLSRALKVAPGETAFLVNGRVIGPIGSSKDFHVADFKGLEEYEHRRRADSVIKALSDVTPKLLEDKYLFADVVSMTTSIIASSQQPDPSEVGLFDTPVKPRQKSYQLMDSQYTMFELGDNSTALYNVGVILDPLSETAQKWSSLLQWLSDSEDVYIEVHLNPGRYSEVPLKKFYRYNLIPTLSFDKDGQELKPQAIFESLPVEPIYTMAMDVPTAWLVRPREALYDLDNIQLNKLFPGDNVVEAVFDLDHLVIEGHAREAVSNVAPRGVQLQLVERGVAIDDTQVVANLGYFQFKAVPGVFKLETRPGRSSKIFKLDSAGNEGWDSPTVEQAGDEITVTSFEGLTLYPRLTRRPGMETVDVLEEEQEPAKGVFEDLSSRVMSFFKSPKTEDVSTEVIPVRPQADINIFTVASGLLYERFEFIPHMAEKYNFQYELVTYKWPSWLRAQTEKQRIIWAYKILFLDVLFPMDLKKVIFVDADQIVRADLKELVDLDLEGAPYGYTPMGDDNTDMEGFRFWKTGYWKEFLQGKPYHISALYVIDLLAAGDILRGQYQALSADPNSLANLDQDLPNNIQNQVPIFSLHEDWLWCETWCSKDRLESAKTIDLCQNPLTKEPKLARARQIPEWDEYDQEIARFTRALAEEGKIHSRMATADANVLAGAGPGSGSGSTDVEALKEANTIDVGLAEQPSASPAEVGATAQEPVRDEL
ncbi:hypothetical protein D9619_007791 [Psilocybe cf. subviscida]|uniref:Glycosyltransferase family 24 protein n=1 Tax=Psilocybe cf. subviscida TaxID=2480587 RepID=A0A8H5AUM7_9AGAR|nr:hypothetical protein D9619_007791 [Psilocybe cf. subviscida]